MWWTIRAGVAKLSPVNSDGHALKAARLERGWDFDDAADALIKAGAAIKFVSAYKNIQRWESGKTKNPRSRWYGLYQGLLGLDRNRPSLDVLREAVEQFDERLGHIEAMLERQDATLSDDGRWRVALTDDAEWQAYLDARVAKTVKEQTARRGRTQ